MRHGKNDSFEDFLNEKFFAENPMTLDDEWPDAFSDWLAEQDIEDLVRWGQKYSDKRLELNNASIHKLSLAVGALEKIKNGAIEFPDYDWSDWNGADAQREAKNLIGQFASLVIASLRKDGESNQ